MNRLAEIEKKFLNGGKEYYKYIKYPDIAVSVDDAYVISKVGDRIDSIAYNFYNNPDLWWVIVQANPNKIRRDSFFLKPGIQIRIPANINNILEDFEKLNKRM
tara:strand:+ start:627 stop:935 length:309 start_codon:yes stop_codon:yes gene_type:complete